MIEVSNNEVELLTPEEAKKNCKSYLEDVERLQEIVNIYIEKTTELFQISCNTCVEVWTLPSNTIFARIKRSIEMKIVNHYLNRYSCELSSAGILQKNLGIIPLGWYTVKVCDKTSDSEAARRG